MRNLETFPKLDGKCCRFCHKRFSQSGVRRRHERIHTGIKEYFCRICGKAFARADSLRDHQSTGSHLAREKMFK